MLNTSPLTDLASPGEKIAALFKELGMANSNGAPVWENCAQWLANAFNGKPNHPSFYARHQHDLGIALEQAYAEMHNAKFALATSSGEAAISLALWALTKAGDTILSSEAIFGTTKNNIKSFEEQDGRKIVFVWLHDLNAWEDAIKEHRPKMIFLEAPSNPLAELGPVKELAWLCEKYWVILVCDSTFAPAPIFQPLSLDSNMVVVESATKFMDGAARATWGMIALNDEPTREKLFNFRNKRGSIQTVPNALYLLHRMQTLTDRILKQSANAQDVAQWIQTQQELTNLSYLGLPNNPHHQLAKDSFVKDSMGKVRGFWSMMSFSLEWKSEAQIFEFIEATRLACLANLGQEFSIVTHSYSTTHSPSRLSAEDIRKAWVTPYTIRLSMGVESPQEIQRAIQRWIDTLS